MTSIVVRFGRAGLHHWPGAPDGRAYLRHLHRHRFEVSVECQVGHGDRDIEFHDLAAAAGRMFPGLGRPYPAAPELIDFGAQSCEVLAERLAVLLAAGGWPVVRVVVSEDGESDGVWEKQKAPA